MADSFELEVATPERLLIRETVKEAQIPAAGGMIGVLPDHAALLGELGTGVLSFNVAGGSKSMVVSGGWIQIRDNQVRVLADRAEFTDEIDLARAQEAMKRAQERLQTSTASEIDVVRALNAAKRAEARLAAAQFR